MFGKDSRADSKGAGVNGVPVARQSRDPARPEAGESATLHHVVADFVSFAAAFSLAKWRVQGSFLKLS